MKHNSILFCLLLFITANLFTANAKAQAINTTDSLALVDLYNSTSGPNWYNHSNWLTMQPVSAWFGVVVLGNRVNSVTLRSNRLSGTIPASIGNLTQSTVIDLDDNQLSGNIPLSIGKLAKLTTLELSYNDLSGTIPDTIGNLVQMVTLSFGDNQLTGTIPSAIGKLVNLKYLDLYTNKLGGNIPTAIGNLVNAYGVYLSNNQLTGSIPESIGDMVSLRELFFDNNSLGGAIPAVIGNLKQVTSIRLNDNQLTGSIPSAIGNLKKIQDIFLYNNQLSGAIPAVIGKLKNLITIDVSHNQLSGNIPSSFHKLNSAYTINLSYNHLTQDENIHYSIDTRYTTVGINNNYCTFNGIEFIVKHYFNATYAPQDTILPIHQNGNRLLVSAGGTLSNNTYKWRLAGDTAVNIVKADSTFAPAQSGRYYVKVTNKIARKLTLYSDTIDFVLPQLRQSNSLTAAKMVQPVSVIQRMQVFPNPASNIIHIQVAGTASIVLTNSSGKTLLTKTINNTADINISQFANGTYYLQNKTTCEVKKVVVIH